jgi:hypothetical protein
VTRVRRVLASGALALVVASAAAGPSRAAVQVVELSAERATVGAVVTLTVAITGREAGTAAAPLFVIPSGTFGDSPEAIRCESVPRAVDVGTTQWRAGSVDYEGASYAGFVGEATFTVPDVPPDTYRLAESIDARGTGCHIFTTIEIVAALPDTAVTTH